MDQRVCVINNQVKKEGDYILYLPLYSPRISYNYTLKEAIALSHSLRKPLFLYFPLSKRAGIKTLRHLYFLLEGLVEFERDLRDLGLNLFVRPEEDLFEGLIKYAKRAVLMISDFPYLKEERALFERLSKDLSLPLFLVEGNLLVPARIASSKAEPYARTLRPKLQALWQKFSEECPLDTSNAKSFCPDEEGLSLEEVLNNEEALISLCDKLNLDKTVPPVRDYFRGGYREAFLKLKSFLEEKFPHYAEGRSEPGLEIESNLSPYLRYGFISPVEILRKILERFPLHDPNVKSFFNELVVWRELARNFTLYNPYYDSFEGLPQWAKATLKEHERDPRERIYELSELEKGEVFDTLWKCAQRELLLRGKIHNYLRMYWCKRLLYWTKTPDEAFKVALHLNNKYALDGDDPNSYLGVAWCFGAFDHPFRERPLFGKVRAFTLQALRRKENLPLYVKKWS